jgi:superfamily II DNA or RNA helicase
MKPRIYEYKGFVMIDPKGNQQLYNKLRESTFLTSHPKGRMFYFMINNTGLSFLKSFRKFFESNFELDQTISDLLDKQCIDYIIKRDTELTIPTFNGITWKDHQKIALEYIAKYKQFCIFLGPGTGKTLIALGTIKMLEQEHPNNKYLIVTPKKAIDQYVTEIKKYLPKVKIITDPSEAILLSNIESTNARIAVVNYESVMKFANTSYDCVILDESHKAKNVSSDINKTLCKIKSSNTFLFTGTPQDKSREEVLAQLKILNDNLFSVKYLLYERFFVLDDYYNPIKEKRPDELKELISQCSYGEKTEDIIDLPSEEEWVTTCNLDKLKETYNKFKKDKVLKGNKWLALGDSPAKHRIKLTQLCSGFIIDEVGISHRTTYNPKEESLKYLVNLCKKAIIYTCFDEEQAIVKDILTKEHKNFVCVNGKTKDSNESIKKFKEGTTDFLVIQIVSGNAALDFPNIDTIIYYSLHDSFIYYEQSKYRIKRIGQTHNCKYYYLIVKGTVEVSRLQALKNKKSFNNREFEIYKRRTKDEY